MKLDIHSTGIKFENVKVFGSQELEGDDFNLDESGIINLTQEQIDQWYEEFSNSVDYAAKTSCEHVWKLYDDGMRNRYNYCIHCDVKE